MGFIDDVDHGTDARSTAKTTRLDSGFSMSGSELSLWEVTLIWRRLMNRRLNGPQVLRQA